MIATLQEQKAVYTTADGRKEDDMDWVRIPFVVYVLLCCSLAAEWSNVVCSKPTVIELIIRK